MQSGEWDILISPRLANTWCFNLHSTNWAEPFNKLMCLLPYSCILLQCPAAVIWWCQSRRFSTVWSISAYGRNQIIIFSSHFLLLWNSYLDISVTLLQSWLTGRSRRKEGRKDYRKSLLLLLLRKTSTMRILPPTVATLDCKRKLLNATVGFWSCSIM